MATLVAERRAIPRDPNVPALSQHERERLVRRLLVEHWRYLGHPAIYALARNPLEMIEGPRS